jgi:hypothetical protein
VINKPGEYDSPEGTEVEIVCGISRKLFTGELD